MVREKNTSLRVDKAMLRLAKIESAKDVVTLKIWVEKLIRAELERRGVKVE
jgi:predicted HicB family RNase H-like nuclease